MCNSIIQKYCLIDHRLVMIIFADGKLYYFELLLALSFSYFVMLSFLIGVIKTDYFDGKKAFDLSGRKFM